MAVQVISPVGPLFLLGFYLTKHTYIYNQSSTPIIFWKLKPYRITLSLMSDRKPRWNFIWFWTSYKLFKFEMRLLKCLQQCQQILWKAKNLINQISKCKFRRIKQNYHTNKINKQNSIIKINNLLTSITSKVLNWHKHPTIHKRNKYTRKIKTQ